LNITICRSVIIWVIAAIHPAVASSTHWQQPAFLLQSFEEVALGSEDGRAKPIVHKWLRPVKVYVDHQVGDVQLHDRMLNAHIRHLKLISGHNIQRVSSAHLANVRVLFTQEQQLYEMALKYSGKPTAKQTSNAVCLAGVRGKKSGEIVAATIYIPVDRARQRGKLVACIVEELTQVLGLPRDSDKVFPSIFNDHSTDNLLSGLDDLLLRILFDQRIQPGMDRSALRQQVPLIIKDLQSQGMIQTAEQRVRQQSPLYDWLEPLK